MQRSTVPQLLFLADAPPLSLSLSGADPGWHAVLGATHKVASILMLGALQSLQMPHVENWMPWQSWHAVRAEVGPLPRGQAEQFDCPLLATKRPAGQFAHGAVVLTTCLPDAHTLQLAEPAEGATEPAAQSLHSLEPRGKKRPAAQATQPVLEALSVWPGSQAAHKEGPSLHNVSFFTGVPWSHLQVLLAQFEVQTMTLRMRWLYMSTTSAYLPAGSMATPVG